jgi:hypothetical protein
MRRCNVPIHLLGDQCAPPLSPEEIAAAVRPPSPRQRSQSAPGVGNVQVRNRWTRRWDHYFEAIRRASRSPPTPVVARPTDRLQSDPNQPGLPLLSSIYSIGRSAVSAVADAVDAMGVIAESAAEGSIHERMDLVRSARQERVNRERRVRREARPARPTVMLADVPNSFPVPRQPARPTVLLSDDPTAIPVFRQQAGQVFVAPVGYTTGTPMLGSEMHEIHIQEYLAQEARQVAHMAARGDEGPLPGGYQIMREALGIDPWGPGGLGEEGEEPAPAEPLSMEQLREHEHIHERQLVIILFYITLLNADVI